MAGICWELQDFISATTTGRWSQLRVRDLREHVESHPDCPADITVPEAGDEEMDAYLSLDHGDWALEEFDDRFVGEFASRQELEEEEAVALTPIGTDLVTVDFGNYAMVKGGKGMFAFWTADLTKRYGDDYRPAC